MDVLDNVQFESGKVINPVFGSYFPSNMAGKIIFFDGDKLALTSVEYKDGTAGTNIPIGAIVAGNTPIVRVITSTLAANKIWVGLR